MIRKWMNDIREKTENMNREQTAEYVFSYYWYHMLLAAIAFGLLILVIYHIGWGDKEKDFTCVLVNQQIDYERDESLEEAFQEVAGMKKKKVEVDSDYLISYGNVQLEDANESSYEKFFFNWMAGEVDAVLMPESFYDFCNKQGGTYTKIEEMLGSEEIAEAEEFIYQDQGENVGIYVEDTLLSDYIVSEENDPVLLVFPADSKHKEAGKTFARFVLGI